jgi:hypothetical protein
VSLFKQRPKRFITPGKDKLQIIIDEISDFDEEPYAIAAGSYTEGDGEIEAGYSVTITGQTTKYWCNDEKVKAKVLRVSIKVNSSPVRHRLEQGVIGGGVFESEEYLEVELNVEPRCVKDIVEELRRDKKRGIRIDGYAISAKVLRVAYFLLFPSKRPSPS